MPTKLKKTKLEKPVKSSSKLNCWYFYRIYLFPFGRYGWFTNLDITWWTQYSKQIFSSKLIVVRTWLRSNSLSIYGGTIASASWLGYLLFYPSIDRQRKIKAYRRKEEHLIKS